MKKIYTLCLLSLALFSTSVFGQLTGWAYKDAIRIQENGSGQKINYQVLLTINTQALVSAGRMMSSGNDIRFAKDCNGASLYNYWIESGMNTSATKIWVMIDTLAANGFRIINMFYGKPGSVAASSFDGTFPPASRLVLTTGSVTLTGTNNFSWFEIGSSASVITGYGVPLIINARKIKMSGLIDGTYAGHPGGASQSNGQGPGGGRKATGIPAYGGGGGGTNGGAGGYGGRLYPDGVQYAGQPGFANGTSNTDTVQMGSGGSGGETSAGGAGGCAVTLNGTVVEITGTINVDGDVGLFTNLDGAGAGGAGGTVRLKGYSVTFTGIIYARGGMGGSGYYGGGGGGGGRVKIFYEGAIVSSGFMTVNGGAAGSTSYDPNMIYPTAGSAGTTFTGTFLSKVPSYTILPHVAITAVSNPTCQNSSVTINASSGFSNYNFLRNNISYQNTSSPTYTSSTFTNGTLVKVLATYSTGCIDTSNVITMTVNPLPTVTVSPSSSTICANSSTSLTSSGAATYTWTPATGLSATTGATVTASPTSTTTYTVTGTSSAGCTKTATVTVTVNPAPVVTVTPTSVSICVNNSTNLMAGGALSYTWGPSAGLSSTAGATVTAAPIVTTTYTVTGTNSFGCINTATTTVTVDPLPTVTVTPSSPSICINSSTSLTANGASTYSWSPSSDLSSSTGATVTANPSVTTTYTITGTSSAGCAGTGTVTVTVDPLPVVTVSAGNSSICMNSSTNLSASGATTYSWSPSGSLSAPTGASVTANPTATTTYTVTGTSSQGCVSTTTITISVNPAPVVSVSPSAANICINGSANLTASGADTYSWSPSNDLSSSTGASVTATPTSTTTYIVTGTDLNGCVSTASVTVTVDPLPTITITPGSPTICMNSSTGLTAGGANTYSWTPSTDLSSSTGSSVTASPTVTTTYTVTGTTTAGCVGTATVTVTVDPLPTILVSPSATTICENTSAPLLASGAFSYAWSPANSLSSSTGASVFATPNISTTYTVIGTSANGCTSSGTVTVTVDPAPLANAGQDVAICAGDSTGLNATGGTAYSWSPSTGLSATNIPNPNASPAVTTTYTVTVTDNGCSATAVVTVTVNPIPAAPVISQNGNILTSTSGVTYQWYDNSVILPGETNQNYTVTQSGTYSVCITDVNGCSSCSSPFTVILSGVNEEMNGSIMNVYPNPNGGQFNINLDLSSTGDYNLEIRNTLGQVIYSELLENFSGKYAKGIDVKSFGSGIYNVSLKNSTGMLVKRIVVQ